MNYIEIVDGVSIRIDAIESIERKDDLTCVVRTQANSYDSTFPYTLLLQLIERKEMPEPTETETQTLNILKEVGTPAH